MESALQRALVASSAYPAVAPHVRRAVALARFEADDPGDGPFRHEPLSSGVPQAPLHPLLPALAGVDHPLVEPLEALQHELIWAADCAEFSDATNNARQYLRAAGHVDLAARAVLALTAPGLGLVRSPPTTVRELAASLGLSLDDLLGPGEVAFGMLPPSARGLQATFAWDIHHEEPVGSAEALGPRELTSYRVGFDHGRTALPAELGALTLKAGPGDAFTLEWRPHDPPPAPIAAIATPEELPALAPVNALELAAALGARDAFARTVDVHMSSWQLATPEGPLRFRGWTVFAALRGAPTGQPLPGIVLPAARAVALGPDDVVRHIRVTDARGSASPPCEST